MYDFVIVGAGPAGSSAAEALAKKGARVLVIDRKKKIGFPVQCGETVTLNSLKAMGMDKGGWIRTTLKGYRMLMPNNKYIFIDEGMAILSREIFENELYERAKSSGAIYHLNEYAINIKKKDGGYRIFTSKDRVDAKYIIGADGPVSLIGNFMQAYEKRDFVVASINYAESRSGYRDYESIIFSSEYPDGYGYIFPRNDGKDNVGVVLKGKNLSASNKEFLKRYKYKKIYFTSGGLIPLNFKMKYYSKEGIMLCGDAAGLTSSVSYGGIYPAVVSGRLAGQVGAEMMDEKKKKDVFKRYDRILRKQPFFQKNGEKNHEMVYSMKDRQMNLIGELANGRSFREISIKEATIYLIRKRAFGILPRMIWMYRYTNKMTKY